MDQSSLPSHTTGETAALRESIQQDGVFYPVLLDASGNVIDGRKRTAVCKELGMECPTKTLDVDQQTADRLRQALNGARRGGQATLDWYLAIAALVPQYEEEAREAGLQRMAEGGRNGSPKKGTIGPVVPSSRKNRLNGESATQVARAISADLGHTISPATLRRAKAAAALPPEEHQRIREGKASVFAEIEPRDRSRQPASKSASKGANKLPELGNLARIRYERDRNLYRSMMNAPVGALNLPNLHRLEQIQELLTELSVLDPKVAVTQIPPNRCREFIQAGAKWWAEFTELCEQRRQAETPELEPWVRKSAIYSDVLGNSMPVAERHLTPPQKAALDIWRKNDEPMTWEQVAIKIKDRSKGKVAKELAKAGFIYPVGKIGRQTAYKAREPEATIEERKA